MQTHKVETEQNLSQQAATALAEIIMNVYDIKPPAIIRVISPLQEYELLMDIVSE
ncbi:hypothetical protein MHB46_21750 [Paenibacillus sp. FSL H7-0703]|uniref:hypothetical protein n=1 Tax=Paenibacillus sp. FSL H7-0703 TaxID=2921438 RepID=UPI0030F57FBC